MSKPVHLFAATLSALAALSETPAAFSQTAPVTAQHYFFGDSDLEQGNLQILTGADEADFAPYYCFEGLCRDSNGPVWVEQLGLDISAALSGLQGADGLNFAVSGGHMTDRGDLEGSGVSAQIALFSDLVQSGQITVTAEDRFFIHAGANDFTRLLDGETPETVAQDLWNAAEQNVQALAGLGARTIYVAEVQDVSRLPMLNSVDAQLRGAVAGLAAEINAGLDARLAALSDGSLNIVQVRQNAFLDYLADNAQSLGFEAPFNVACFDGATICANDRAGQDRHVFFDDNHYGARAHALLGQWYLSTQAAADGRAAAPAARLPDLALADHATGVTRAWPVTEAVSGRQLTLSPVYRRLQLQGGSSTPSLDHTSRGAELALRMADKDRIAMELAGGWVTGEGRFEDGSRLDSRRAYLRAAASHTVSETEFQAHAAYSIGRFGLERETRLPGLVAQSELDSRVFTTGLSARQHFPLGAAVLALTSRADYMRAHVNDASETGADGLALHYQSQSHDQLVFAQDVDLFWTAYHREGLVLSPSLGLSASDAVLGRRHALTSQLINNSAQPAQTVSGLRDRHAAQVRAGLEARLGDQWRLGAHYERSLLGDDRDSDAFRLDLSATF